MRQETEFLKLVNKAKRNINEVNITNLKIMIENDKLDGILIDVREEYEHNSGHIPNSLHVSRGILESKIEAITSNKNQKIYLYCGGGYRSALSAESLEKMGYRNVYSIAGGYRAWLDA